MRSSQRRSLDLVSRDSLLGPVVLVIGACLVVVVLVLSINAIHATDREVITRVTDKERVCSVTDGNSSCQYLIFTQAGTFKLTDSIIYGKFRSSDVYGVIMRDSCYRFSVHGWRLPAFSSYPNIHRVEAVSC